MQRNYTLGRFLVRFLVVLFVLMDDETAGMFRHQNGVVEKKNLLISSGE